MKHIFVCTLLLLGGSLAGAQTPAALDVLKKFEVAKPSAEALAFYSLDWAPDLAAAQKRAAREGRPVLLIYITNISAATDFYSGHC